jgi:hypothetical protein
MAVQFDLNQVIFRMNVVSDPRPIIGADSQPSAESAIRTHPAFCQLALPVRSSKGVWRRDVAGAFVVIEAGASLESEGEHREGGLPIPTGKYARLLLMQICDAAIRADSAVVDLGASAREFAEDFDPDIRGPKLRELTEQLDRVLAAKITVSLDGGLALAMFDARGRSRGGAPVWRPSVRLNSKFFATLTANQVVLDRRVVDALAETPMAMDAYTWVSFLLPKIEAGAASFATWEDLMARFAPASQQLEEFRAAFEQSLRQVSELCPMLSLVIREQGVECRVSARRIPASSPVPAIVAPARIEPPAPELAPPAAEALDESPEAPVEQEDEMAREIAAEIASSLAGRDSEPATARDSPSQAVQQARPMQRPPMHDSGRQEGGRQDFGRQDGGRQDAGRQDSGRDPARPTLSLKSHLTGLSQVIWLQRAGGRDNLVIEVTPGGRYDPENVTVLALEPMILQIAGGLNAREFERVSAWANANRDLIDDFWEGSQESFEEITGRVKKVPPPGWR